MRQSAPAHRLQGSSSCLVHNLLLIRELYSLFQHSIFIATHFLVSLSVPLSRFEVIWPSHRSIIISPALVFCGAVFMVSKFATTPHVSVHTARQTETSPTILSLLLSLITAHLDHPTMSPQALSQHIRIDALVRLSAIGLMVRPVSTKVSVLTSSTNLGHFCSSIPHQCESQHMSLIAPSKCFILNFHEFGCDPCIEHTNLTKFGI